MKIDLSIIIVNYRQKDNVKNCLLSISKINDYKFNYEVIIVENGFGEGSFKSHDSLGENVTIIFAKKNLGMGKGNNAGIDYSLGEYILMLNPDIIISGRAIEDLFFYLKNNPEVGIIGPKLISQDNSLLYSCYCFPKIYTPFLRRTFLGKIFTSALDRYQMKNFKHDTVKEVDWLCGASLMFKKSSGLKFDNRYFMYFEDVDICRSAWKHGLKVIYYPKAVMKHLSTHKRVKMWHVCSYIKYFLIV